MQDYTDRVLEEWRAVLPDVDVSTAGIVNRILRLARLCEAELDRVAAAHGLSTKGDFDTLAALRRQQPRHELSPTQLADVALITTGGMTSRLDRLEHAGYVERHSDPADRRALLVRLTAEGRRIADAVLAANLVSQSRLVETLSGDDRVALAGLLRKLLTHLGDG